MRFISAKYTGVWVLAAMLAACSPAAPLEPASAASPNAVPNPASQFCQANGGTLEVRTASDGAQSGVCVFADASECDEWAFFRGECQPGTPPSAASPPVSSPGPLALEVLLPEDGAQIELEQCQVIGTTSPGAVVSVNDEILIAGADGTFQTTVLLEPGVNLIEVLASDASGAEAFTQITVTYEP